MPKLQTMAQELAVHSAGTSSDVGRLLNSNVNMLPTTGRGHTSAGGEERPMILNIGVSTPSTWRNCKRSNVLRTCILLMAITGAVLGTRYLVTKMRDLSAADHYSSELVIPDEIPHFISHATTYRLPQIFRVGGPNATWVVPATSDFFTSWAASISFRPGDVLRIVGGVAGQTIVLVPDAQYAACTTTGGIWSFWWVGNTFDLYIQLVQIIANNFVQGDAVQCIQGLKFSAVVNSVTVPPAPPRPNVNAPNRQPGVFEVGGASATWTLPASATFYEDWASNISFLVGDVISFTFSDSSYNVAEVPYSNYEMCTSTDYTWYVGSSNTYQFTKAGIQYFVATTPQYCIQGMKFTVNIYENGSVGTPGPSLGTPASPDGSTPTVPNGSPPSGSSPSAPSEKSKSATGAVVGGVFGGLFALVAAAGGLAYHFSLCKNINLFPNIHLHQKHEGDIKKTGEEVSPSKSTDKTPSEAELG